MAEAPRTLTVAATLGRTDILGPALGKAEAAGIEWISLLGSGEEMRDDALGLAMPALPLFDAVFGGLEVDCGIWRPSRLAFDEAWRLPHALLNWWVGSPRFLRASALRRLLDAAPDGEGGIERLFRLWDEARCIKLAVPLARSDHEPDALDENERDAVLERLASHPVFTPVPYGDRVFHLPYTGRNAGIEREQTRGLFFEAAELEALKARVQPGAHVVDVGANTGNHTVFFSGPMRARSVLPFEPLPFAGNALRSAVEANGLGNVDLSMLGRGVGAVASRMRVERSERGGLGATRLVPDEKGSVEVVRLDDVLTASPDFLKIDVEGMEMEVLEGAASTIERARPVIFIEIANANTGRFLAWLELAKYRVERIFSDKGHANFLIRPQR